MSDQIMPKKVISGGVRSGQVRLCKVRGGQDQLRSAYLMSGQYKVRSDMLASGYGRSGQVGTDWIRS